MHPARYLMSPLWPLAILSSDKSLVRNPVLASEALNRRGLHRWRVATAAAMAGRRRRAMAAALPAEARAAFERDGFFRTEDFLPAPAFERLVAELLGGTFAAWEMRQGETVTRLTPVTPALRQRAPAIAAAVDDPRFFRQIRYAAGRGGLPIVSVQTIIVDRKDARIDPQTALHTDTFHSTSKAWLFLHDVGEDDGPFMYVPGSHRLTEARLEWEHQRALTARDDDRHRHGSFRLDPGDLERLGLPEPQRVAVKANTLIVADTFGFHGRTPSSRRETTRIEIHADLRRNPFMPWNGGDPKALPLVRDHAVPLAMGVAGMVEKATGKRGIWRPVGEVAIASGAHI